MSGSLGVLRSLDRDAWILLSTRALRSFSASILSVSLAIYLSKLGASSLTLGLLFTATSLFAAVRSLPEGLVADRWGRKPVLLFTGAIMAAGGLVYVLTTELWPLMASAVVFTVSGSLPYTPAEQAMLSEKVAPEHRTSVFSLNSFMETMAGVFGSLVAAAPEVLQGWGVAELESYRPVFLLFALSGTASFLLYTVVRETRIEKTVHSQEDEPTEYERTLVLKWSAVLALDVIGGSFITNFLSYWFYLKWGMGPAQIGVLFGATRLFSSLSYYLGLRMAQRVGTIKAIVLSRMPGVAVNFLTPLAPSFAVAAYMQVFKSFFSMIDVPLRQSYLMGVIRSRRKASAVGMVSIISRFTAAGAPLVSGYIIQYVSVDLPFMFAAGFQFASAALMYLLFKDVRPPEEASPSSAGLPAS
ncbi:MAG: MFS transporter [Candidatus Bathyarchaeota archaeon]